jgi:hypothetical protein
MNELGPWTTEDYDRLSWHDAHVYGFRLDAFDDENGSADLVLDIDYILQWDNSGESFLFTVCQAELRFHEVFRMQFSLDYATPTAGMSPFCLADIEREALDFSTGYKSYRWRLPFNWPQGQLEFEAPRFTQTLIGTPMVHGSQRLPPEKRRNVYAA